MATQFSKLLGSRIRYFRKLNGLTQEKLAEKLGIETQTLAHIEIGKNLPSLSRLPLIAECLNIEVFQLFIKREVSSDSDMREAIIELLKSADDLQLRLIYDLIGNVLDLSAKH